LLLALDAGDFGFSLLGGGAGRGRGSDILRFLGRLGWVEFVADLAWFEGAN
jgi:hypothetical protein